MVRLGRVKTRTETDFGRKLRAEIREAKARSKRGKRESPTEEVAPTDVSEAGAVQREIERPGPVRRGP